MVGISLCSSFRALIKLFYQLQNRRKQRRQESLHLNHYPIGAMTGVFCINSAAETGAKKIDELPKFPDF